MSHYKFQVKQRDEHNHLSVLEFSLTTVLGLCLDFLSRNFILHFYEALRCDSVKEYNKQQPY